MFDLKKADPEATKKLAQVAAEGKLAHAYLFAGLNEKTSLITALWLACYVNCLGQDKPDSTCNHCLRILRGDFPDVVRVEPQGNTLSINLIRPLKEELAKSPDESDLRVFIIEQAEKLTQSAANAMLNLLEEPVAPVVTILITNNRAQILPTIRSRTQIVNFKGTAQDELLNYGLSSAELESIGQLDQLNQEAHYLYQELLAHDQLSLMRVHSLASLVKNKAEEKVVFIRLKQECEQAIQAGKDVNQNTKLLVLLLKVDQMLYSNVNMRNCLDYLVLKLK
jgi:DNA polymerase-3 subunit delta'